MLIHLMVLSIPAGKTGKGAELVFAFNQAARLNFAPLNVLLAPHALQAPQRVSPDEKVLDAPPQTAASLDTLGQDEGHPASSHLHYESSSPADAGPAAGVPVLHYYHAKELSQRARMLRDIDPFLGEMKDIPGTGKAVIALWINERGGVDRVEMETSDLNSSFEKAVLDQFQAAHFQPAEREGVPVKSLMRIEVEVLPRSRFSNSE